jgi:hypothetical protein
MNWDAIKKSWDKKKHCRIGKLGIS